MYFWASSFIMRKYQEIFGSTHILEKYWKYMYSCYNIIDFGQVLNKIHLRLQQKCRKPEKLIKAQL